MTRNLEVTRWTNWSDSERSNTGYS